MIEGQLPDRADFFYRSLPELTLNLTNVNQLKEFLLMRAAEDSGVQNHLDFALADSVSIDLIKSKAFRDVTLHSLKSRGVIPECIFRFAAGEAGQLQP